MKMTHFFLILESLNRKKEEHLEVADCFAKKIIESNEYQSSSVKSIAVKTSTSIKYNAPLDLCQENICQVVLEKLHLFSC